MGAEGMGLYQLVFPVYNLAWSITCSGFTTTVSKLTAQEKAKGENGNVRRILRLSVIITTILGIVTAIPIYFFANDIASAFFNEPRIGLSFRVLSLGIPFMAAGSCVRGYFFGVQESSIPALNQVLEQLVRMAVIFLIINFFIPYGLEYVCAAATIGIVVEEIFSFGFVYFMLRSYRATESGVRKPRLSEKQSLSMIFTMAAPLTANRVTGSLLAMLENALIPRRLQAFGLSAGAAMGAYGQISGMALPLVYFPSAFLISLSISLVPAVSEASATGQRARINYTSEKSMLFACVIGFCAAAMFIAFSKELGLIIYNQDLSHTLLLFGIMCPLLYMQVVLSGILNGLGFQTFIFRNSLISSVISIAFIYFLTPLYGVDAFIAGWFIGLVVVCALEVGKLKTSVSLRFDFLNWFLKPLLCAAVAGLLAKTTADRWLFAVLGNPLGLAASLAVLLCVYLTLIVVAGCVSTEDIRNVTANFKKRGTPVKEAVEPAGA
jgi:stage V sporulation protein B